MWMYRADEEYMKSILNNFLNFENFHVAEKWNIKFQSVMTMIIMNSAGRTMVLFFKMYM